MDTSLTFSNSAALFGAMLSLALLPSVSVITVSARSAAFGFVHGASTAAGIVVGDMVFILIAILGLAAIAEAMESLLTILKYAGGAYLVWLGIQLWRSKPELREVANDTPASITSSFMTGFLITLGDQKAILFYLVFFPAFVDLSKITFLDGAIIIMIASVSVGGAKLGYAFMADKAALLLKPDAHRTMSLVAGFVMISVGMILILKP